mmetsp:Transcript_14256/g.42678  ORF Transcript_14256/g.42678 Transcript_14256/m.42678 type:complete len:289 (-) Transcript_14256:494-1360(-)
MQPVGERPADRIDKLLPRHAEVAQPRDLRGVDDGVMPVVHFSRRPGGLPVLPLLGPRRLRVIHGHEKLVVATTAALEEELDAVGKLGAVPVGTEVGVLGEAVEHQRREPGQDLAVLIQLGVVAGRLRCLDLHRVLQDVGREGIDLAQRREVQLQRVLFRHGLELRKHRAARLLPELGVRVQHVDAKRPRHLAPEQLHHGHRHHPPVVEEAQRKLGRAPVVRELRSLRQHPVHEVHVRVLQALHLQGVKDNCQISEMSGRIWVLMSVKGQRSAAGIHSPRAPDSSSASP